MQIVAALFVEGFDLRSVAGPATRIDLTGVHFSMAPPGPFPVTLEPHLVVLLRCPTDHPGTGALEAVFRRVDPADPAAEGDEVARNVQPVQVDPGRFGYRLVRAELEFDGPGTIEASVSLDRGAPIVVPLTMLAPPPPSS